MTKDETIFSKRCLDTRIPKSVAPPLDASTLPSSSLPLERIPDDIKSLQECAERHIRQLLSKENPTSQEEDALDDGFVLCDLQAVRNKLDAWRRLFPRIKPFFALKCNPDPMVAAVLGQQQQQSSIGVAGFDCASIPEIKLALQVTNHNPKLVVYANPQRAEKDLDTALELGVRALTFDGPEELYKVHAAHQKLFCHNKKPPDMILRLLVPDQHSSVPLGEKFGVPLQKVSALAHVAVQLGLPIVGVSFHCGSGNHDPQAYRIAIQMAAKAIEVIDKVQQEQAGLEPCWLLDIGGGYPGRDGIGGDRGRFVGNAVSTKDNDDELLYKDKETAAEIAQTVNQVLEELYPSSSSSSHIQIIAEPGRYFVEGAFAFCGRIYQVRLERRQQQGDDQVTHRHYFIAQGVQGLFKDCILCGETFVPTPLALDSSVSNEDSDKIETVPSTIHGPSGEDNDVICKDYPLPVLQVGDWLIFDRVGAYTLSISARSGVPPIRYVLGGYQLDDASSL